MLALRVGRLLLLEGLWRAEGAVSRITDPFGFTRIVFEFDDRDV